MTAKTVKAPNYTDEQTTRVVSEYVANRSQDTVDALAIAMGRTTRSIIAKLSREGVYQKKAYVSKTGEKVEKKDETADAIGAVLKMTEGEIESLTKANKTALKKIFAALANSRPITPEDDFALSEAEMASLKRCNKATREKVFAALAANDATEGTDGDTQQAPGNAY